MYWGDTHLHTSNSFDVYLFGTPTATPETAYRFAMGRPVVSPTTHTRWQLSTPLDFLVVADHAEAVGSIPRIFRGDPVVADTKTSRLVRQLAPDETTEQLQAVYEVLLTAASGIENEYGITARDVLEDLHAGDKRRTTWDEYIATADRFNEPGVFTTLIGWEWSSIPGGSNLHRVVFMPQGAEVAGQFLPFSLLDSTDAEDLWSWLEDTSTQIGADFVAIPHNPNISIGRMFPLVTQSGDPVDAPYGNQRMKWERVVEVTQIKGDSEAHPLLSPTDEFADYETYPFVLTPDGRTPDPTEGDYLRSGLKRGLELEATTGVNPYKVGMTGATDSHTGMSAVEENNFAGKGQHDAFPDDRPHPTGLGSSRGWDMGAAGLAGVWAEENTREAIFAAFQRREVYGSTGPRIPLRFFGGFGFEAEDANASDLAAVGYDKGVPMGADLRLSTDESSPTFLVGALKDPMEANLDRIQIIKAGSMKPGRARNRSTTSRYPTAGPMARP